MVSTISRNRLIEQAVVVRLQAYAYLFVHLENTAPDSFSAPLPSPLDYDDSSFVQSVTFKIFETTPAPTVRPPSRIAKRNPSSIATGVISSPSILMLSPGITISVPSGSVSTPVTSVVRK